MTRRHRCRSGHVSLHNQPWKFWKTISTPFFTKAQVVFHTSIIEKNKNVGPKEWFHGFLVSAAIPSTFYCAPLFRGRNTPSSPIPVAPRDVRHIVITQVDDARTHPAWIFVGDESFISPRSGGVKNGDVKPWWKFKKNHQSKNPQVSTPIRLWMDTFCCRLVDF